MSSRSFSSSALAFAFACHKKLSQCSVAGTVETRVNLRNRLRTLDSLSGLKCRGGLNAPLWHYQLAARSRGPAHVRERFRAFRDATNERPRRRCSSACVAVQLETRCRLLRRRRRRFAGGGERRNIGEHLVVGGRGRSESVGGRERWGWE